jgi:hypothetical protein
MFGLIIEGDVGVVNLDVTDGVGLESLEVGM